MKNLFFALGFATILASCSTSTTTETAVPATDSTAVCVDTTAACAATCVAVDSAATATVTVK